MSCPSTQFYQGRGYVEEIWTWFSIGTLVVFLRLAFRLSKIGLKSLQGDDYLAVALWLCFVAKSVALTIVFTEGSNIDYGTDTVGNLTPCQLEKVKLGSRMELLAWYAYIGIIWGLKGMVLFIFRRLTFSLDRPWLFKSIVAITVLSYIAMFLTLSLGCLPFHHNWQVLPPPPTKCSMRMHDVYVSTLLNVSTDLLILTIPLPALWRMTISWSRKIGLTLLLCSGIFVVAAALIRFGFTIVGSTSINLNRWCQRESTVGIIAVNMPILYPCLRSLFLKRRSHPSATGRSPNSFSAGIVTFRERSNGTDPPTSDTTSATHKLSKTITRTTTEATSDFTNTPPRARSEAEILCGDELGHLEKGFEIDEPQLPHLPPFAGITPTAEHPSH